MQACDRFPGTIDYNSDLISNPLTPWREKGSSLVKEIASNLLLKALDCRVLKGLEHIRLQTLSRAKATHDLAMILLALLPKSTLGPHILANIQYSFTGTAPLTFHSKNDQRIHLQNFIDISQADVKLARQAYDCIMNYYSA
jgi:hypothetical protein